MTGFNMPGKGFSDVKQFKLFVRVSHGKLCGGAGASFSHAAVGLLYNEGLGRVCVQGCVCYRR
jgi:hypothetical protein